VSGSAACSSSIAARPRNPSAEFTHTTPSGAPLLARTNPPRAFNPAGTPGLVQKRPGQAVAHEDEHNPLSLPENSVGRNELRMVRSLTSHNHLKHAEQRVLVGCEDRTGVGVPRPTNAKGADLFVATKEGCAWVKRRLHQAARATGQRARCRPLETSGVGRTGVVRWFPSWARG
jgi:hypothetical protein